MNIVVTGGLGNVGKSTVRACLAMGHSVTVFEAPPAAKRARNFIQKLYPLSRKKFDVIYGDIRKLEDINAAVRHGGASPDAIIHLAALIPPASDKNPKKAWDINVEGTKNIIAASAMLDKPARIVLASSIATYGDRLENFWIKTSDPFHPSDIYSRTKIECERLLMMSGLPAMILRLSYVVSAQWLPFDPLLFSMPPGTHIEIVHTEDAGRAFATAASIAPMPDHQVFDIGGGVLCRTSFRAYLDRLFRYFGLGDSSFLPDCAFASSGFHCGWYEDSDYAESILRFRSKTLEDYYEEVRWETRHYAPLVSLFRPFARDWLLRKSPFLERGLSAKKNTGDHTGGRGEAGCAGSAHTAGG